MSEFKKEKLHVEYKEYVEENWPIDNRKYTLTHSDETGDLFLTIGLVYDFQKLTDMRDEVLGQWAKVKGRYNLYLQVHLDGKEGIKDVAKRDCIFRKELPLVIRGILYGDRELIEYNSFLKNASIIVYFKSTLEEYDRIDDYGKVINYMCGIKDIK